MRTLSNRMMRRENSMKLKIIYNHVGKVVGKVCAKQSNGTMVIEINDYGMKVCEDLSKSHLKKTTKGRIKRSGKQRSRNGSSDTGRVNQ